MKIKSIFADIFIFNHFIIHFYLHYHLHLYHLMYCLCLAHQSQSGFFMIIYCIIGPIDFKKLFCFNSYYLEFINFNINFDGAKECLGDCQIGNYLLCNYYNPFMVHLFINSYSPFFFNPPFDIFYFLIYLWKYHLCYNFYFDILIFLCNFRILLILPETKYFMNYKHPMLTIL